LAKLGIGPNFYGSSDVFRLEEYIDSRVMLPTEMNQKPIRRKLARAMTILHQTEFEKLDKTGFFVKLLEDQPFYNSFNQKCNSNVFTEEEAKFINVVKNLSNREELEFIRKVLPTDETVFCHNDLLGNNILVVNETSEVRFIDFEYGNYNFRGSDIGNMFAETTFDYTVTTPPYYQFNEKNYPSDEDLSDFIGYYLVFNKDSSLSKEESDKILEDENVFQKYQEAMFSNENYTGQIEKLLKETKIGSMLFHYYYSMWAIVMSKNPDIDFDHVQYSKDRYESYQKMKEKIVKLHE